MMNKLKASAAALALAAPLAITEAHATDIPQNGNTQATQLSVGCQFYTNVMAIADTESFDGAKVSATPADFAKAGAQRILRTGHVYIQEKDGNPDNNDSSKPLDAQGKQLDLNKDASDVGGWQLGEQKIILTAPSEGAHQNTTFMPVPPSDQINSYVSQCSYLEGVAAKVHDMTGMPTAELMRHATAGAAEIRNKFDTHTVLIADKGQAGTTIENLIGHFGGTGIEIYKEEEKGPILIKDTVKGYGKQNPGEKVGLKAGDEITYVNGKSTLNMSTQEFVEISRGVVNTPLTLTIKRKGEKEKEYPIIRDEIVVKVVDGRLLQNSDTAVIKISSFSQMVTSQFIREVARLATLAQKNAKEHDDLNLTLRKVILDLRGNGGGFLDQAKLLNDLLVDANGEGCVPLVASGKTKDDDVVCADSQGAALLNEINTRFKPEVIVQDNSSGRILVPSILLEGADQGLMRMSTLGMQVGNRLFKNPHAFDNLNKVNIFELLKRMAVMGIKDENGNPIITTEVIQAMEIRAKVDRTHVPGLDLHLQTAEGESLPVLTIGGFLQNKGSASASEITSGIMKDGSSEDQKVPITGSRSYGKGSVQTVIQLNEKGEQVNIDRNGYIIKRDEVKKELVATTERPSSQYNLTDAAFFGGRKGLSNHGSGVTEDEHVIYNDFRDAAVAGIATEAPGLVAKEKTRALEKPSHDCKLKKAVSGILNIEETSDASSENALNLINPEDGAKLSDAELRKAIPTHLILPVKKVNHEKKRLEDVKVFDADLECAWARMNGKLETLFVTREPHTETQTATEPAPAL
jgi:C-terminal processing protease CtpA/Prc